MLQWIEERSFGCSAHSCLSGFGGAHIPEVAAVEITLVAFVVEDGRKGRIAVRLGLREAMR